MSDPLIAAASLIALVFGSWCVSEGGEILGEHYDATIIGGIVIAWLNTAPETVFFITALESGNPRFAMGAVSGSVIVVCTIAAGACIVVGSHMRKKGSILVKEGVREQAKILASTLFLLAIVSVAGFNQWLGVVCVLEYVAFLIFSVLKRETPGTADLETGDSPVAGAHLSDDESDEDDEEPQPAKKGVAYLTLGGLVIFLFSEPFVSSIVNMGEGNNINPLLLAYFFAPVASEAPEILESISLARKGKTQNINIALSNLVGGTISKTTLLTGIMCFYGVSKGYVWEEPAYSTSMQLIVFAAGVSSALCFKEELNKTHGALLFLVFLTTGIIQYMTAQNSVVANVVAVASNGEGEHSH